MYWYHEKCLSIYNIVTIVLNIIAPNHLGQILYISNFFLKVELINKPWSIMCRENR